MTENQAVTQDRDKIIAHVIGMADNLQGMRLDGTSQLGAYLDLLVGMAYGRGEMELHNSLISFSAHRTEKAQRQLLRDNAEAIADSSIYRQS